MGKGAASVTQSTGHPPKVATAADATPGIDTAGYGSTLYVISFGELEDTLSYTLEDSDDNSTWATASVVLDGVASQTLVVNGVANTSVAVLVHHSGVRRYHRLLPASGAGDNLACVVALKLEPAQELGDTVDYVVGG